MVAIRLRGASRRMREISLFVPLFFLFFRFFNSPTGRHSRPIFTIYTSNDALSRKKVHFGVSMMNFHIYPPFIPQNLKICITAYMATSNGNNSGIFKDRSKMFAPKLGVFGVGQFNGVVEISLRPTLVTMVTNWWFSSTKLPTTQLKQEIEQRMLH